MARRKVTPSKALTDLSPAEEGTVKGSLMSRLSSTYGTLTPKRCEALAEDLWRLLLKASTAPEAMRGGTGAALEAAAKHLYAQEEARSEGYLPAKGVIRGALSEVGVFA